MQVRDGPLRDRLLGAFQRRVAGSNPRNVHTVTGRALAVSSADTMTLVGGYNAKANGCIVHGARVMGTVAADWIMYIGDRALPTAYTTQTAPKGEIAGGARAPPWGEIRIYVRHADPAAQDFEVDLTVEDT